MLHVGKIKLREIKELQNEDVILPNNMLTPLRKRKNTKSATTAKKLKEEECDNNAVTATTAPTKTARKKFAKSAVKETPSDQKRIDSYFTTCPKTYDIKFPKEELQTKCGNSKPKTAKTKTIGIRNTSAKKKTITASARSKARRKRLFTDTTEPSTENISASSSVKATKIIKAVECITIDSDTEEETYIKKDIPVSSSQTDISTLGVSKIKQTSTSDRYEISLRSSSPITASSLSFGQRMSKTSCENRKCSSSSTTDSSGVSRRKPKPCPPYKVIENTTFAVDAFQFGYIENVTHYFLTHFHADHYIGLTKSFAMPLYMSHITARLLRKFIPVQEEYIHEIELNQSFIVNDMEVTALDANHCPGAILIVFKFLDTGKCILHTGDFRACHEMESEPIFWNNHIHTIYLDTTYISDKYAFCTQYESIMKAQDLIEKFIRKHAGKRILYICGSYIVGKEKFWSSLAEEYEMKVWAEGIRYKALKAMNEDRLNRLLVTDPNDADMHVIPMGKLSYLELVEYFKLYEEQYDIIFAIRPSGWEKDTKPRYGNKINVVGIEYSEHSSYAEMQRFVKFLKPDKVISTVPRGRDHMKTGIVPTSWYKYDKLKSSSNYQPSIESFLGRKPLRESFIRLPNANKGGVEYFVSPLKLTAPNEINTNFDQEKAISIISSNSTEPNKMATEFSGKNTNICLTQNSAINLQNNKNIARTKKKVTALSTTTSSEDFEKSDFIFKTKRMQLNKKNLQEKSKSDHLTQTKPQRNKKQLSPKNTNIELKAKNSEEYFETPEEKLEEKNKSQIESNAANDKIIKGNNEKTANCNSLLHYSSEDELHKRQSEIPTKSNKASNQLITVSFDAQTQPKQSIENGKKVNTKLEINSTTSQSNPTYKSNTNFPIDSTSIEEWQESDKTVKHQNLEILITQKRMTRSKSASIKTTKISCLSQNNVKLTQQSNKIVNTGSKFTTEFNTSQENPIFKSTTYSTVDSTSADEIQMKPNALKSNSPTSSENWFDQFEYPTISTRSKRHTLNHTLTPLKKTKPSTDTKTILNTILEQKHDIDRFNCSQLAGLVVESVNKQNPDYSKDHIPTELLSDADDDWM